MLSGLAGDNNQFSYGVTASRNPGGEGTSGTVNGQYTGSRAMVMAGYGTGRGYNNYSAGLAGSIVAHPGGVTLSPYPGDTVAGVAAAPEAAGARVLGYAGVQIDASGHAVLPYLLPYRINEVAIDPSGISPDVELKTASQQVAPRAGAIVMLHYATAAGRAVLIDASLPGGAVLPFGADVVDGEGNVVGSVGQAGRIYARLLADEARLSVHWGPAQSEHCTMHVALAPKAKPAGPEDTGIERVQLACTPSAAPRQNHAGDAK
jgi:outer membrane usher protein